MSEDVTYQVQEAIAVSKKWSETGWPVTFGPRNVEVSSLKQAQSLPKNFIFRQEAVNYWNQVKLTGNEAADSGQKALDALKDGNFSAAENALYFCQYIEKPFTDSSKTWLPLYEALKEKLSGH
ncbi:MAG: hypothetical protein HGA59_02820 [Chlorobiaceae bacterium]|jgi:hypothetical protein|nr:hypothetical protein [Chlorobiaceae bacterium]NTV16356.1 hypothetical protein [Chlorobiaceae bacterium]